MRVVLRETARAGLADEVRAAIPNAVEVVLESSGRSEREPRPDKASIPSMPSGSISQIGSIRREGGGLFAELLESQAKV